MSGLLYATFSRESYGKRCAWRLRVDSVCVCRTWAAGGRPVMSHKWFGRSALAQCAVIGQRNEFVFISGHDGEKALAPIVFGLLQALE